PAGESSRQSPKAAFPVLIVCAANDWAGANVKARTAAEIKRTRDFILASSRRCRSVGVPMRGLTHGSNLGSSTTGGRRAYRLYRCRIQHMEIRNLGESINAL